MLRIKIKSYGKLHKMQKAVEKVLKLKYDYHEKTSFHVTINLFFYLFYFGRILLGKKDIGLLLLLITEVPWDLF